MRSMMNCDGRLLAGHLLRLHNDLCAFTQKCSLAEIITCVRMILRDKIFGLPAIYFTICIPCIGYDYEM